jgi:hypothetical protein
MGSKRAQKRHEADDLRDLKAAARQFNCAAPIGTYQLDHVVCRLARERAVNLGERQHQFFRTLTRDAIKEAYFLTKLTESQPISVSKARKFIFEIGQIRTLADHIWTTVDRREHWYFCNALEITKPPVDGNGQIRFEDDVEFKLWKTDELANAMRVCAEIAQSYLDAICLTAFKPSRPGNRAVPFTYYLIQELSKAWAIAFGSPARRMDVADMSDLMMSALIDFKYPLTPSQRDSRTWLDDRIRKQIFRK